MSSKTTKNQNRVSDMQNLEIVTTNVSKGPVKYRDPNNPFNTWSGEKRRPKWLNERLSEGFILEELLADKSCKPIPKKGKYVDPNNPYNTWEGKGRRPSWLKEKLQEGAKLEDFLTDK